MKYSGFGLYLVGFSTLHTTLGFIFGGDMFGGGNMGAIVTMSVMDGLMGGGMDGTGHGMAVGGMDGGGMGTTGGAMGGMESFYGVAMGGAGGTMGGMDGFVGGGMGGLGNTMGGMESLFGGIMGSEMGAATGMHSLLGGEMATGMGGGGMNMFSQFGQGQKAPVTKKCMSPFWLKYCKCNFACPQGHVSYGNCEDYKENSFLPTMCCPETVHYACVGFEF